MSQSGDDLEGPAPRRAPRTWAGHGDDGVTVDPMLALPDPAPPRSDAPWEGEDRFVATATLGVGGMGRVLRVHDQWLRRDVARKQLRDDLQVRSLGATHPVVRRFLREARVTAQLEHPNIVPVYDAGRGEDGELLYTMRLIQGRSLAEVLSAANGLDARLALLPHIVDLCQAVAFAHSRGVVHRDLKPANVMLGAFGETMVVDWGLARVLGEVDDAISEPALDASGSHAPETRIGQVLGTPLYMPPEQAEGREVDARADVWSLGAVLFEVLTGQSLWPLGPVAETLARVRTQTPARVRELAPDVPRPLAAIVDAALQPLDRRVIDAAQIGADLERWARGAEVSVYRYSPLERIGRWADAHRGWVIGGGLGLTGALVVALIAAVLLAVARERAVMAEQAAQDSLAEALANAAYWEHERGNLPEAAALAARAAERVEDPRLMGILALALHPSQPRVLGTVAVPHGCSAELLRDAAGRLWCAGSEGIWRLDRGQADVLHQGAVTGLDVREGRAMFTDGERVLRLAETGSVALDEGNFDEDVILTAVGWAAAGPRMRAEPTSPGEDLAVRSRLQLAADDSGQRVVAASSDGRLSVHRAEDWSSLAEIRLEGAPRKPAFSPDGSAIVIADAARRLRMVRLQEAGEQVTMSVLWERRVEGQSARRPAWRPSGTHLALTSSGGEVVVLDATTGHPVARLPSGAGARAVWDATGSLLHVVGQDAVLRTWHIPESPGALTTIAGGVSALSAHEGRVAIGGDGVMRVVDGEGAVLTEQRFERRPVRALSWSPDGSRLAASGMDLRFRVYETEAWTMDLEADIQVEHAAFTPDGQGLWGTHRQRSTGLARISLDGRLDRRFEEPGYRLYVSSRGQVAWIGREVSPMAFFGPDGAQGPSGPDAYRADWHPDGEVIAISTYGDRRVALVDPRSGEVLRQTEPHPAMITGIRYAPSGQRLAMSLADGSAVVLDAQTLDPVAQIPELGARLADLTWNGDDEVLLGGWGPQVHRVHVGVIDLEASEWGRRVDERYGLVVEGGRVVRVDRPLRQDASLR